MKLLGCLFFIICSLNARSQPEPEMVFVKGGTFVMKETWPEPRSFKATLSDYYISKTEITFGQFKLFNDSRLFDPTYELHDFRIKADSFPAVNVVWERAVEYCEWLSKQTGKKYRLPTEAEWEYAALGGADSKGFPYSGGGNPDSAGWVGSNSNRRAHKVAQKMPNELGLYDMTGNMLEWCLDWYAPYPDKKQMNPAGAPKGKEKIARGGAFISQDEVCIPTWRFKFEPYTSAVFIGFRIVCEAKK